MDIYEEETIAIQRMAAEGVNQIMNIWLRIFDDENIRFNLSKLDEHVSVYFNDLIAQSLAKEKHINAEIQSLQDEANTLRRLLHTEVNLPEITEDMPRICVQSELDKSLKELRDCLRERKEQICELLLEQEELCEELDEQPRELLDDPLPTAEELEEFSTYLSTLRELRMSRLQKLADLRREIKQLLKALTLHPQTEKEERLLNHREVKLNNETLNYLQRMRDCYNEQMQQMSETIDNMRNKVVKMWDRLNTSPRTRDKFKRYTDYCQHTYDMFYEEEQRCETLVRQNIKQYVQNIRVEISEMWDKLRMSEVERNRFSTFNSNCYTDDLLVLHELELEDLKRFYEQNKEIYELFDKRKTLWERMIALESQAKEPGRYNNRGGQLLKEEKERKMIASKLPKIEQEITQLVKDYEQRAHKQFLVYGENILDMMKNDWELKRQAKEKLCSARKNAQTPLTKANMTTTRTPMSSARNASRMAFTNSQLKPATGSIASKMPPPSSLKRKLNAADRHTPVAKRSLMHALNSPSVYQNSASKKTLSAVKKSTTKRIIGNTVARRNSGRYSGNVKKRRSQQNVPRIVLNPPSSSCTSGDENYETFEKCIEPVSRSSVIHEYTSSSNNSSIHRTTTRSQRMHTIANDENARLAKLPRPRVVRTPTPSRVNMREHMHSPGLSNRKLTTKNLPIII